MKPYNNCVALLCAAFGIAGGIGAAKAQSAGAAIPVVPFSEFVAGLRSTTAAQMTAQPMGAVKSTPAAEEMRQHLLKLYSGVAVSHSYALGGQIFDCVPIEQQPGLQAAGLSPTGAKLATPPPLSPAMALNQAAPGVSPGGQRQGLPGVQRETIGADAFGNKQGCGAGAIPMRRITLQEMSHFETLQKFFEKGPNGAGQASDKRGGNLPPAINGHSYAHEYQYVTNYGGYAVQSMYNPYVYTGYGEIFSLAQHWYVAGSGAALQTAEIGLQNYPAKYGSENSALFIYWTADDYKNTGCYNLDCGAFVQTNSNWHLGAGFNNYSTVGGAQYELALGFYLYAGNWWMAAGSDWVGYYPGWRYAGGALSHNAQAIDYGGETVGSYYWPPMGSGQYASAGWPRAAYFRSIVYRDAGNGSHAPSLSVSQQWPACYTATAPTWGGATWQTYFFFGGLGGYNC